MTKLPHRQSHKFLPLQMKIFQQLKLRATEDWLFVATTTCGGNSKLAANNEEGNILTFMFTNKAIED